MSPTPDTAWPETLPQTPLQDGWQETLADNVLRTEMEQGPPKLRRRGRAASGKMTVQYLLTRTDCETLDAFYQTVLSGGVLPFVFPHPRRNAHIAARFAAPPDYAAVNGDYFRARLSLEVLYGDDA